MIRELRATPKFERAYRKFVRRQPGLQAKLDEALRQLHADAFAPSLATHKLSGQLFGLLACSCGYDCRIIFAIENDAQTHQQCIVLVELGTHDEVY